ncbi:AAA family ATPase [Anabaena sp. PCC 7938]|uniref:Cytidyltransferase-related domain protein n=1 Tax=Anabaena cylindrica (strain ATCC 27899 / PCC 7122) TaxID=272123 RepID=K9ZAB9_ANACC|nr:MULTISPECIES: AAA family ATPase [Anabaena]AFZ55669.1 cytidyltransferase-related domain protein [Anabaena cylindrica PCC 7122]MCM2406018.1 AAA family ATPase [Anabaena sp. CCAP 1446/1C]BAY01916.1 ATPase/kinase involved in NAD metabolism [Anabaena cylindrica PCC 7122]
MEKGLQKTTTGMILGKFMPPHLGHKYLVDFARNYVDDLTVLVCSIQSEPIPGDLRYCWMKQIFSDVNVVHVTDENPQEPKDDPNFWQIWYDSIRRVLPTGPDYVFASEDYGWKLAEILGASYIPVDHGRNLVPVSGTQIRQNSLTNWRYLPESVRPYFVRRVCIFGAESTGKSTLTQNLANHYHTVYVSEYARGLLDFKGGHCDFTDIPLIARGQMASEDALVHQANKVIFCDTDLITTTIWSDVLFGKCPRWIEEEGNRRQYDLYLLLDVDVPWVNDSQRFLVNYREEFRDRCIQALESRNRPYIIINGDWKQRWQKACRAVDELLER